VLFAVQCYGILDGDDKIQVWSIVGTRHVASANWFSLLPIHGGRDVSRPYKIYAKVIVKIFIKLNLQIRFKK